MNYLQQHWTHLAGGGGSVAAVVLFIFKDSLQRALNGWLEERRMARQAHLAASGKDKDLSNAFIGLLKSDLESQARTRDDMAKSIGRLAETSSQILIGQDQILKLQAAQTVKIDDMNKELLVLKGAMLGGMR